MKCPYCKENCTRVIDKRNAQENVTRRRRECESCKKRFTTYERVETLNIFVEKRDGSIEDYERDKLKRGILKATSKREVGEEKVEELIKEVEDVILASRRSKVKSVEIGELVLERLTKLDKLSALLFASVYKEFKTLEQVQVELERLSIKGRKL